MTNLLIWGRLRSRTTSVRLTIGLWTTQTGVALCSRSFQSSTPGQILDFISQMLREAQCPMINLTFVRQAISTSTLAALTRMKVSFPQVTSSCPQALITSLRKRIYRSLMLLSLEIDQISASHRQVVISLGRTSQSNNCTKQIQTHPNFHQLNNCSSQEPRQCSTRKIIKMILTLHKP